MDGRVNVRKAICNKQLGFLTGWGDELLEHPIFISYVLRLDVVDDLAYFKSHHK